MVQAAESWQGLNLAFGPRGNCDCPTCWRVLRETQVRTVLVIVAYVLCHEPLQVPFIQDDHMVEQVSPTTPNPALRNAVLPWTAKGGAGWLASDVSHRRHYIGSKL